MFTNGQLVFALFFVVTFFVFIAFAYRKDRKLHLKNYKGVKWVVLAFVVFIVFLFAIKGLLKN